MVERAGGPSRRGPGPITPTSSGALADETAGNGDGSLGVASIAAFSRDLRIVGLRVLGRTGPPSSSRIASIEASKLSIASYHDYSQRKCSYLKDFQRRNL